MNLRKDHYCFKFSLTRVNLSTVGMRDFLIEIVRAFETSSFFETSNFYTHSSYEQCIEIEMKIFEKILSGGSLGSYVDEGRSKMREIVWIAGHIEHRYSERKLQSEACLRSTPVWGSLINLSNLGVGNIECVVRHSFWLKFVVLIYWDTWFYTSLVFSRVPHFWPQIRREHSLNLSILLSEGKETN